MADWNARNVITKNYTSIRMSKKIEGIWIGEKDLTRDPEFIKDARKELQNSNLIETIGESEEVEDLGGSRRDFLKMMGFGVGAAAMAAGCDIPVKRAIPYVIKPDEIVPGVASYYASSFVDGGDYCSILVKTREGRPIKIEGNSLSKVTHGGTSARAQASVLSLYDVNRLKNPAANGETMSWDELDTQVQSILSNSRGVRFVTHTMLSPTDKKALGEFIARYPGASTVTYDPVSSAAILEANESSFGERVIPSYHFDQADIIVGFNADFLGTWISPIEFAHQYAKNRKIKDVHDAKMSHHVQVESQMSVTGSNADNRILVKPSEQGAAIAYLYQQVMGLGDRSAGLNAEAENSLRQLATKLTSHKGRSLIVSGSNNTAEQVLVNALNLSLGNYGQTLSFEHASLQRQGDEAELAQLIRDINNGTVDTVIFNKCNPAFEYAGMPGLQDALNSVTNKIALSYQATETTTMCDLVAPIHHTLESWGDAEPKKGLISLIQPAIHPLFDTRQMGLSLLTWAQSSQLDSSAEQPYYEYLKSNWENTHFANQSEYQSFQAFWDKTLHDGTYSGNGATKITTEGVRIDGTAAMSGISRPEEGTLEIQFVEPISIGNGQYSNNPWLQEMPDPVNRCAWGNYLAVPVDYDGKKKFNGLNGLKDGDMADITVGGATYRVPVVQQFGQMKGTVALAIGYGRTAGGACAAGIGNDVNPSIGFESGRAKYYSSDVTLSGPKGKEKHFSAVQYHHTMGVTAEDAHGEEFNADETTLAPGYGNIFRGFQGALVDRSIIRQTHINNIEEAIEDLAHEREHHEGLNQETLYPYTKYVAEKYSQGHHWGMHVDLNACTGCGACTVACMAENNVPVVGKKQVARHQEMSWIRIDRYYYGDVDNPNVVYQPMMCQHCDNAPCENVCPVNATNHSSEGLNQMTYNRCIGTRYCANNCPYKVRRFNWLDYTTADTFPANQFSINGEDIPYGADNLTRMVLNPDVTVRSRGVIEKCSFCVQRIQEGKLTAKQEQRALTDGDVRTACQTACPTGAITFGDQNAKGGELSTKFESPLNMIVLEETNVRSSVQYTMKVHNRDESLDV